MAKATRIQSGEQKERAPGPGSRAAIYTRISRDSTLEGAGVRRQERECRDLVKRRRWKVARVFSDNDLSAFSGVRRPGYEELLKAIESGLIDVIVVWHTDRLYRRAQDLEHFIKVCEPRATPTYPVQESPLDLATASGRLAARTLGSVAQYEAEHKGERQRAANWDRALQGRHRGSRRCFGYEPDGVTIRETEAIAIREGVRRILNGASLRSVAKYWNEQGLHTPQGKRRTQEEKRAHAEAVERAIEAGEAPPPLPPLQPSDWVASSVRLTLRTARLAGLRAYKGEVVRDPETGELVKAEWPGIIDFATWSDLQRKLDEIAATHQFPSAERQLLSGLARCASCGGPIMSGGRRNGRRRYRCRTDQTHVYRESAPIDDLVEDLMVKALRKVEMRALLAPAAPDVDAAAIQRELADIDAKRIHYATMLADDEMDDAQFKAANKRLAARRAALEEQLPAPVSPVAQRILDVPPETVANEWALLDQDEKRALIDALFTIELAAPGTKENAYKDWRKRIVNPETVIVTPKQQGKVA